MKQLEDLYKRDQYHIKRWEKNYSDKEFHKINKEIRKELEIILKKNKKLTPRDHFLIAIIYQHGFTISSSKKALRYAKLAVEKGYKKGKWLIASATDRLLQLQGKSQKFGTQPIIKNKRLKQYKTDRSITDEIRKEYGLPTLKQLKRHHETHKLKEAYIRNNNL